MKALFIVLIMAVIVAAIGYGCARVFKALWCDPDDE